MNKKLSDFFKNNETRIGEHYTTSMPLYYSSLRHGFDFFFKTFRPHNFNYENYAFSLSPSFNGNVAEAKKRENDFISREFTDNDSVLLSIISFQRFFELFMKTVLESIDARMVNKISDTKDFLDILINDGNSSRDHRIEAGEALGRIQMLFSEQDGHANRLEASFLKLKEVKDKYPFFKDPRHIEAIRLLTHWRNRLLHGGSVFPNLRSFDYLISKQVIPLVSLILQTEPTFINGKASFYLTTLTGIDLLNEIECIDIDLQKLEEYPLSESTSIELLRLGHLKELGRANMEMNNYVRMNKATYEYNYRDPLGRGIRFAKAEMAHEHFVTISVCPCCNRESLVLYKETTEDIFHPGKILAFHWVTCYTCSYHIRYNVGDPFLFGLAEKEIFYEVV